MDGDADAGHAEAFANAWGTATKDAMIKSYPKPVFPLLKDDTRILAKKQPRKLLLLAAVREDSLKI
jgi:hypothetical protein